MSDINKLFDLSGQVAVITGGAGLLGSEFCQTLAEAGASVIIADIDHESALSLAGSINALGLSALALETDVVDKHSVEQMVSFTLDAFGRLDILVNNAALDPKLDPEHASAQNYSFEEYPIDAWETALKVNLTGMFLCSQAAVPPMIDLGKGVMINLCSIYGLNGPDQRIYQQEDGTQRYKPVYYSVTKAGVLGLTRYLAAYYAGRNIRINALTPGGVFNDHAEGFVRAYSARTILGRMARKDELNGALLFLASDASSYMTGANLVVDGGWTAW
ncbi:MAG: SDR family oxidoreductase [Anaerolineales bacterium]|nr:SDR family oxidoreductase [Anaerolineales bacterium]